MEQSRNLLILGAGQYGVMAKEIAEAMKEQLKLDVDKKKISLAVPIRNEGTFSAAVKLHPQVTSELTVKVEGI